MREQLLTQSVADQMTLSQPGGAALVASYASADCIDMNDYTALYRSYFGLPYQY